MAALSSAQITLLQTIVQTVDTIAAILTTEVPTVQGSTSPLNKQLTAQLKTLNSSVATAFTPVQGGS